MLWGLPFISTEQCLFGENLEASELLQYSVKQSILKPVIVFKMENNQTQLQSLAFLEKKTSICQ